MADVAQVSLDLVSADQHPTDLSIKVDSPAWESDFETPDDFRRRLDSEDLGDVTVIEITANAAVGDRKISVRFKRVSNQGGLGQGSPEPVVTLHVAGDDRTWVKQGTESMKDAIRRGVPARLPRLVTLGLSLALLAAGVVLSSVEKHGSGHKGGVALLIGGGAIFAILFLSTVLLPPLELLPEGKTPRRRVLMSWGQREGVWLVRVLIAAAIGSGLTLLFQHV